MHKYRSLIYSKDMDDPQMGQIIADVEKELLNEIIANLDKERMTVPEAKKLAGDFLKLLPMEDKQDLLAKLYNLSKRHREAKELYLTFAKPYEEEERQRKLELISQHIKNGQIEHAISVAKGEPAND